MEKQELEYWKTVTTGSSSQWVEDTITSLNGNGKLYYIGGEKGRYMRITPAAELQIGTYEHALSAHRRGAFQNRCRAAVFQ
jgi:hypothetical protein